MNKDLPQTVLNLHAFEGYWSGTATIQVGNNPVMNLRGFQKWQSSGNGWSLHGEGHWEGEPNFIFDESFQAAFDAATNLIHWQVMFSQGPQAFTVLGNFNSSGTELTLARSMMTPQGLLEEQGAWTFLDRNHRTLLVQTKVNGQLVARMTADVKRQ